MSHYNKNQIDELKGIIHIVGTHKRGGEGSSQMRTIAYKGEGSGGGFKVVFIRKNNSFWATKSQNFSFFVQ